jgi:hypothetical protein
LWNHETDLEIYMAGQSAEQKDEALRYIKSDETGIKVFEARVTGTGRRVTR